MNLDDVSFPIVNRFFAGIMPSVLTSIISSNNYVITTGFLKKSYFGKKGTYIDNFKSLGKTRLKSTMLCIDIKTSILIQTRLFGVCNIFGKYYNISSILSKKQKKWIEKILESFNITKNDYNIDYLNKKQQSWVEKVLNSFQENSYKKRPQFSFFYIYSPNGHTPGDYRHSDLVKRKSYRNHFLSSSTELNNILHHLIDIVKIQESNSIVMVFGDHGTHIGRGISREENPGFVLLNKYAVELAVLKTKHPCVSDEKIFHYSPNFATPSRVLAAIFRCLAKEPKEVDKLVNFVDSEELYKLYKEQFFGSTVKK